MTKTIETLIPDIQDLLTHGKKISDESAQAFGNSMAKMIQNRLQERGPRKGTLRMSNMGKPDRQLWYEVNHPEKAEKLHPNTYLKFILGDIVEELLLFLVAESGHSVEGAQGEMELEGIKGHRDVVIDGVTVDVKSASPFSFAKFQKGLKADEDPFGYTLQIQSYLEAGQQDPIVTEKDRGAFLVIQKVTGDIHLDVHTKTPVPIKEIYQHKKEVVKLPDPPDRCFEAEPEGKSGNMKLGVNCSYCSFKKECWPGLRTFLYSRGPVFLTHVEREPDVYEVLADETLTQD